MASIASHIEKMPLGTVVWAWRAHIFEVALYSGVYCVYMLTRGLVFSNESAALANSERVILLEKSLGIFWEPYWQSWTIVHAKGLVVFLSWAMVQDCL